MKTVTLTDEQHGALVATAGHLLEESHDAFESGWLEAHTGVEHETLAAAHDALVQPEGGELALVVSAGHGEYGYVAASGVRYEYLWAPHGEDPGSELDLAMGRDDWDEEIALALFTKLNPGVSAPADCDLTWENVWRLTGTVEQFEALYAALAVELGAEPGGDDDTYDYWPSGVRLARQIAAAIPDDVDRSFELGLAIGQVLAAKGLTSDELNFGI